jgi:two-component system, NarL family, response regulator NreC
MSVTIVVAGNRDIFGQGLRLLLEGQEDFRVIAEATTGLEAGQLVQVLQPNVLVVDFMMSDLSSLEVTRQVRRHSPATHVVILSVYSDDAHVSPPLPEHLIETYLSNAHGALIAPYETLTPREREVLHLAARGLTNREIATALFISPRTVETRRANLMRKLNLRTQADLIRFALQRGILPIDP